MKEGDRVFFRQTCRGGYGFQRYVPAVFVRASGTRVTIEVETAVGTVKRISVDPKNVEPRRDDAHLRVAGAPRTLAERYAAEDEENQAEERYE